MAKIGIIGYGRFGKVLHNLLKEKHNIQVYDKNQNDQIKYITFENVIQNPIVIIAVPIREFKNIIRKISQFNNYKTTILDVCSVKVYPSEIMEKLLPSNFGIISTHPLFGPDSFSEFRELKMAIYPTRDIYNQYDNIIDIFQQSSIRLIKIDPHTHDKLASMSQGVTHFIGRVLMEAGIKSTEINTKGFNDLLCVVEQTCNDSWELFSDLQNYNPYTSEMVKILENAIIKIREMVKTENDAN